MKKLIALFFLLVTFGGVLSSCCPCYKNCGCYPHRCCPCPPARR
ncbi:hypothetical protein [Desulfurobacterium pacificum]|nr:hypothetical protein [Desulfurobacterium pacificum]